jgi:hypothetical protein
MEKDSHVSRARFCARCHNRVPFCSNQFNDPNYDHVNDSTAKADITSSVCRRITPVNSLWGNENYTINAPTRSIRHGSASIRTIYDVRHVREKRVRTVGGSRLSPEKGAVRSRFEERL